MMALDLRDRASFRYWLHGDNLALIRLVYVYVGERLRMHVSLPCSLVLLFFEWTGAAE